MLFRRPNGIDHQTWEPYFQSVSHPPRLLVFGDTDIDAISAIESITKNIPKHTVKNIQIPPAVPPLFREMPMMLQEETKIR